MIDKRHLIKLTQQLIRIRSENPPGDEYRIARFVKAFLEDLGLSQRSMSSKRNVAM